MGGTTFFLFMVEVVTGVLLMFYYRPTLEHAYNDILALRDVTTLGILRELHRWGAHAMVIAVWLHMYRVFLTGSYKPPREFNWVIGVILLVMTLLLSFTGYLLPWDQLAIWAITVGSNMARATPLMGVEGPGASLLKLNGVSLITSGSDAKFALLSRPVGGRDDPEPVLRAPLRGHPPGGGAADHDPLLEGAEGRRDQRADVIAIEIGRGSEMDPYTQPVADGRTRSCDASRPSRIGSGTTFGVLRERVPARAPRRPGSGLRGTGGGRLDRAIRARSSASSGPPSGCIA